MLSRAPAGPIRSYQVQVRVEGVAAVTDCPNNLSTLDRIFQLKVGWRLHVGVQQVERALFRMAS
jgi:hypothetical protein